MTVHTIDPDTGSDLTGAPGPSVEVLLPDERHSIGRICRNERDTLRLFALPRLAEVWHRDSEEFSPTYNFEGGLAYADGRVFTGTGPGLGQGEGQLLALREETGELLWSVDLKEFGGPVEGGKWNPMVSHGLVVINARGGTAAFDVTNGRLAWTAPRAGARAVYGSRVYVSASGWYSVIDLESGRVLLDREISKDMRSVCPLVFSKVSTQINVSETHVFAGDADGGLWGWERDTGEVVWHDHPKGADAFVGVLPVIAGGRLYVGSQGFPKGPSYLYCYEEDRGASDRRPEIAPSVTTRSRQPKPKARAAAKGRVSKRTRG